MINAYIIMQHVTGLASRPLCVIINDMEKAERWASAIRNGSTQIPGCDRLLCRTGASDEVWEDEIEVVVLPLE